MNSSRLKNGRNLPDREPAMRILRCLHSVLILLPVSSALQLSATNRDETAMWQMMVFSLLLLLPAVFSRISERFIGSLFLNLLIDTGLIALTGWLSWKAAGGMPREDLRIFFTVVILVLSFLCVQGSILRRLTKASRQKALLQHDLSWKEPHYFLDTPSVRFTGWFLILYLLGLLFACPVMCSGALLLAALYLVLALFYERFAGTETFLKELHEVSHIPVGRLRRVGDRAVFLYSMACLLAAGAAACLSPLRTYFDLRNWHVFVPRRLLEYGTSLKAKKVEPDLLKEIAKLDVVRRDPLPWLQPLAHILGAAAFLLLLWLLYREYRQTALVFREGFDENGDLIRSLRTEEETKKLAGRKRRAAAKTGREKIRREYRKRVEKNLPGGPAASDTPEEIEKKAQIEDRDLHERYEQARYDGSE